MKKSEMEFAIAMMLKDVNIYSRNVERAKIKNLPLIEREYFFRNQGIADAMFHLGYRLEEDGRRADRKDGVGGIEYMHYKAVKDKELWIWQKHRI